MFKSNKLNEESFNLLLDGLNLWLELRTLVDGHRARHHRPGDSASTSKGLSAPHENVGHILVLAEQRKMKQNLQGLRVCGHHNELRQSTIQCLGCLVCSFAKLLVVHCLLNQIQDLGGESGVGQGVGFRINFLRL